MNIVNAINVVTARKAGTLSVFALEAVNAKLFDKVVEQANAAPTSAFVQVARATLKEKRDGRLRFNGELDGIDAGIVTILD